MLQHSREDQNVDVVSPTKWKLAQDQGILYLCSKNPTLWKTVIVFFSAAYFGYFVAVVTLKSKIMEDEYFCRGDGFFYILTGLIVAGIIYFKLFKPFLLKKCHISKPTPQKSNQINLGIILVILGSIGVYLVYDSFNELSRLLPLTGLLTFILLGTIFSVAPAKIIWRQIMWAIGLQFLMGIAVLKWPPGISIFNCIVSKLHVFFGNAEKAGAYVFGELVTDMSLFCFRICSLAALFTALIYILLYYGVLQWLVIKVGSILQMAIGATPCECLSATANIFLGMSECPMLLIAYLNDMTKSELHAIMSGGFATVTGSVLAVFITFGIDGVHLLTASVMSAPAALGYSKLVYPEIENSKLTSTDLKIEKGKFENPLHAMMEGLLKAIEISAAAIVCLIGFIAFISFADSIINWGCLLLDYEDGTCSLSAFVGILFMPLAFAMGVPWKDCFHVGQLIGTKTIVNEFVAYIKLADLIKKQVLEKRSEIIATYALCGFANFGSIGILLGNMSALVPKRKSDLARLGFSAMMTGNVACFLTACVAGQSISIYERLPKTHNY